MSIKSLSASEDGLDIKTLRSYTYSHDYITAVLTSAREAHENHLLPLPSRVSFARPVLSCAHYFQAPATQVA